MKAIQSTMGGAEVWYDAGVEGEKGIEMPIRWAPRRRRIEGAEPTEKNLTNKKGAL